MASEYKHRVGNLGKMGVPVAAFAAIAYCLVVVWYVTAFPDVGLRCLLPNSSSESTELHITQFVHEESDIQGQPVGANDKLIEISGQPAPNFLALMHHVSDLASAPIPPGGLLPPGSDPSEEPRAKVPPLVEILSGDEDDTVTRMVELRFRSPESAIPDIYQRNYVAVKSRRSSDFLLTIVWFLCQLGILLVALTAWWQRRSDRVIRLFCLMCAVSMVAFVGGFHWWILVASPALNLPFIACACLLPAMTLHFFCRFPRENILLRGRGRLTAVLIYMPPLACASLIAFTYWAAWALMSTSTTQLSLFQRTTALLVSLISGGSPEFAADQVVAGLLYSLRNLCYATIVLSSCYFGLTVAVLTFSLLRTQSPVERRQASGILTASLVSTIPIAYSLYLAFFRRDSFALGEAQLPMFVASGLFMVAYAHGMMKHRLILAEESLMRGRHYFVTSGLVSVVTAVCLGAVAVVTRVYSLPQDSSIALHLASFLVLVIAIGFVLWARDRVQAIVDRRFFSEKYQIDRTLKQLNQASGYLADPSAMAGITLGACRDVTDASFASMYVRDPRGGLRLIGSEENSTASAVLPPSVIAGCGETEMVVHRIPGSSREDQSELQRLLNDIQADLACLLRGDSGVDGLILLGRRSSGAPYSAEDIAFLQAIGQMTVLALHSSRANQSLSRLNSELEVKVSRIAEQQRQLAMLRAELTNLHQAPAPGSGAGLAEEFDRGEIRGDSRQIQAVLEMVRKAAASTSTVLIRGESGTGKELVARVVHRNSGRAESPLVSVNCAALAPSLLESELFGHVRGAFTGASSDKEGRFKSADGGTLFLDEIGDISLDVQVKLLRVLQERCFEPVGSNESVRVDVRLLAATNRNLEEMITNGEFREDLYYRLNVISMTLPPLRDRSEDLIELVFCFLNRGNQKTGKAIRQIEPDALAAIEAWHWPGNIRELENVIERAIVLADGDTITLKDLPEQCQTQLPPVRVDSKRTTSIPSPEEVTAISRESVVKAGGGNEEVRLLEALRANNGNKARAARSLNMPRSTFYSKLKKYGIESA